MKRRTKLRLFVCMGFVLLSALPSLTEATALDDYIAKADPSYTYSLARTIPGAGFTGYVLDMTSQTWRSSSEVDRPDWQHWVTVVVPSSIISNKSLLFVDGGANGGSAPTSVDEVLAGIAVATGTVVSEIKMVPNQPLYFTDESIGRSEDEIIAYSWDKYLTSGDCRVNLEDIAEIGADWLGEYDLDDLYSLASQWLSTVSCSSEEFTGDPNWPVQLAMVKSVVRAMDTIEDYCDTLGGTAAGVNEFVISGASKRGWTTWLTAAVDPRVVAIAPAVIDMLNMERSFRHHHGAYGFWSDAVHDYEDMNIFEWFGTTEMDSLLEIVDPYEYNDRLTMPKYLVNSSGDEFFLPDSGRFYFDDLNSSGGKHIRYVPNTGHSLDDSAFESLAAFYRAIVVGASLPQFSWTLEEDGSIEVQTTGPAPSQVNLWQATNLTARDFRIPITGDNAWVPSVLSDGGGGVYTASVSEPATGWRAFFVELIYSSGWVYNYRFTTVVRVVPDDMPYSCDFDFDSDVDMADFALLASDWLGYEDLIADVIPAFEGDGKVDLHDFTLFAERWQD